MDYIGIDAGGTLIKAAYWNQGELQLRKFPVAQLQEAASWINGFPAAAVYVTGGRSARFNTMLDRTAGEIVEFEATYRGVRYLREKYGITGDSYIVTNVGTGTSIHHIAGGRQERVGGTGVGGGTIMGLSQLLTGITDFDTIVRRAGEGSRERIDLLVRHIYQGAEPPIPGDLTASNFGSIVPSTDAEQLQPEELLASVIGLVGETVATASVLAAGGRQASSILFIGSSFLNNDLLKQTVEAYTRLRGGVPLFLENGEYCGAIGALLHAARQESA